MNPAADLLQERTGVPAYRFEHLLGLAAMDSLVMALADISGKPVPARLERQRAQLQDAMLDTHFMLGQARIAMAADADLLNAFCWLFAEMGAEVVAAVVSSRTPVLERLPVAQVKIGDLEDLEHWPETGGGIGHQELSCRRVCSAPGVTPAAGGISAVRPTRRLSTRLDRLSGHPPDPVRHRQSAAGHSQHAIEPYHSIYSRKLDYQQEASAHGIATASVDSALRR